MKTGPKPKPISERIWKYIDKTETCWLWTGAKNKHGYGVIRVGSLTDGSRQQRHAHRVVYEILVGPIPDGLQLDHLCRVRACVRPSHLEPVSGGENLRRGDGWSGVNARKTCCPQGHPYDKVRAGTHYRRCSICDAARERERSKLRRKQV